MKFIFESTLQMRENTLEYIAGLSLSQLLQIPMGFKNNIAWQMGHILTVQQMLSYGLSGLEMHVPRSYVPMYKNGSSPEVWQKDPDIVELKELYMRTLALTKSTYENTGFKEFKAYTTSTNVHLACIEDAISFNLGHEMYHFGVIASMTKIVSS